MVIQIWRQATQTWNNVWKMYKKVDPALPEVANKLSTTIPMSPHGDEGRGQKKAQSFVLMLESNLGWGRI